MNILVTGGNGMLGKSLVPKLIANGHDVEAPNSKKLPLLNTDKWHSAFFDYDYVIHCAALVGGIQDNINRCYDYLYDNTIMNLNVLEMCRDVEVPKMLSILSTCVYPDTSEELVEEQLHDGLPHETNFGYAYSKRIMAKAIDLCNKQYGTKYNYIIPSNLYGINDHRDERAHFVSKLIDRVVKAKKENQQELVFYGFPEHVRQYLYVEDLADIIVRHVEQDINENYNVAYPIPLSIDKMVQTALKVAEISPKVTYTREIPGQEYRVASLDKFDKIHPNFQFTPFRDGVRKVYEAWL